MNATALPTAHLRRFGRPANGGVVAVRFDDGPITDLPLCGLFLRRGIPVEVAVPAAYVDRPRRLTLAQLRGLISAGHTVANHSFGHGPAPAGLAGAVSEIERAARWFDEHGVPVWSFVQPGPWSASGEASLDEPWRGASLGAALGGRYVCLEGYATDPLLPVPLPEAARFGLSHVTIDAMPWRRLRQLLEQVARERRFVQLVVHTAKCLKSAAGPLLAVRVVRLARFLSWLEAREQVTCFSVPGAMLATPGGGESLLGAAREVGTKGERTYCFKEPLVPGLSYRLQGDAQPGGDGRALLINRERGSRARLRLRRTAKGWVARFGVLTTGDWELTLSGGARRATVALHAA